MGKRVSPPPLFDLDYVRKDDEGGSGGGGGGSGPYYPEEKEYDYDDGIPWYIAINPNLVRYDYDTFMTEGCYAFNVLTIKEKDAILHNFGSYLACVEKTRRYVLEITDDGFKVVCDFRDITNNLSVYELKETIVLEAGKTYLFPIASETFKDESHNIDYKDSRMIYEREYIREKINDIYKKEQEQSKYPIDKRDETYFVEFKADDFIIDEEAEDDDKFAKTGDIITATPRYKTSFKVFYLELNKRAVIPNLYHLDR